jgi:hypothetical protein
VSTQIRVCIPSDWQVLPFRFVGLFIVEVGTHVEKFIILDAGNVEIVKEGLNDEFLAFPAAPCRSTLPKKVHRNLKHICALCRLGLELPRSLGFPFVVHHPQRGEISIVKHVN